MKRFQGETLNHGTAAGPVFRIRKTELGHWDGLCADSQAEWGKYQEAQAQADRLLDARAQKVAAASGPQETEIFEAQRLMLADPEWSDSIFHAISQDRCSAVKAVLQAGDFFADIFQNMEEEIMQSKAADIRDIASLLVNCLTHQTDSLQMTRAAIVVARTLLPGQLAELGKANVLGLVLQEGSIHSHIAILAASMGIPCLICRDKTLDDIDFDLDVKAVLKDGEFFWDADETTFRQAEASLNATVSVPDDMAWTGPVRFRGKEIHLLANIGHLEELESVERYGAEGIGLMRSEFQYIGRQTCPSEDELFETYREMARRLSPRQAVIRTLDIGADKQAPCLERLPENNPALGLRGIRYSLKHPELLRCQLRAVYRASAYGQLALMFPLISKVEEVEQIGQHIRSVQDELRSENVGFKEIPLGIMIETPAAALLADELAIRLKGIQTGGQAFFSIGTNDLTQYCLAVDRENPQLDDCFDHRHPALWKLLQLTVEAAKRHGVKTCVCGEAAHDESFCCRLAELGLDSLSASPACLPAIRRALLNESERK